MFGSIYLISNSINEKVYIGQTLIDPLDRWQQHLSKLKNKKHNPKLQHFINKYGIGTLKFEVIESNLLEEDLNQVEINYIEFFDSFKNGFNCTEGGGSVFGRFYKPIKLKEILTGDIIERKSISAFCREFKVNTSSISGLVNGNSNYAYKKWCRPDTNTDSLFYRLISPQNKEYKFLDITKFCKEFNLGLCSITNLLNNKKYSYKGWGTPNTLNYRKPLQTGYKVELINMTGKIYTSVSMEQTKRDLGLSIRVIKNLLFEKIEISNGGWKLLKNKDKICKINYRSGLPIKIKNKIDNKILIFENYSECARALKVPYHQINKLANKKSSKIKDWEVI